MIFTLLPLKVHWSKSYLSSPGMVWKATASSRAKRAPSFLFVAPAPLSW